MKKGKVMWQELNLVQEYIEYENKASLHAYQVYDGIKTRCEDAKIRKMMPESEAVMIKLLCGRDGLTTRNPL